MPVFYNGNQIIPAPLISIGKSLIHDDNGVLIGEQTTIDANGVVIPLNNPNSAMSVVSSGINSIKTIFSTSPARLLITSPDDSSTAFDYYVTVDSISFEDGVWTDLAKYRISMLSSVDFVNPSGNNIRSYDESWNIADSNAEYFTISHTVTAQGLPGSGITSGILAAKSFVNSKKTTITNGSALFGSSYDIKTSGVKYPTFGSSGYYNYSSSENISPATNSYTLNEQFIWLPSGNARHEYSVTINYESEDYSNATLQVQGTIYGMADTESAGSTKLTNAKNYFSNTIKPSLYSISSVYIPSGTTLSPLSTANSETYDKLNGTLAYTRSYPISYGSLINGAFNEVLDIQDTGANDVFAQIQVVGRIRPIVQYMGTRTLTQRSINYSAIFPGSGTSMSVSSIAQRYLAKPSNSAINTLFYALAPDNGSKYYITSNTYNFNPRTGQYSASIAWDIAQSGSNNYSNWPSGVNNP